MTDLVPIRKGKSTQVSLADLQDRLDARNQIAEARTSSSTRKARVEEAKRAFKLDPLKTMVQIQDLACGLADVFDAEVSLDSVPLSRSDIEKLSNEYFHLDRLKSQIEALETRYRALIFAHLDEVGLKVPGRPPAQVPGKVEAEGPGPHYIFERRGGNRANPDLNTDSLRGALPPEIATQVYLTMHHAAVDAWDEQVFDEGRFGELVDAGLIDLDVVAEHLTPGPWRTPSFYKIFVDGGEG